MKPAHLRAIACLGCFFIGSATAHARPSAANVGVDERIGVQLPGALAVTDQNQKRHALSDYWHAGKPLLLALAYYHCNGLCDISLRELATRLRSLGWSLGADYNALTVSIDPHDGPADAAAKRGSVVGLMHIAAADVWPFSVTDPANLSTLTRSLGYRYEYDPATKQFAHPAVSIVLTPEGKVARYLYGPTLELGTVRLALRQARLGHGGATALIDRTILSCYRYDPASHRYEPLILGVMRGGAGLVALLLAAAVLVFSRRGRARRAVS
jgi:protein SCO1/2